MRLESSFPVVDPNSEYIGMISLIPGSLIIFILGAAPLVIYATFGSKPIISEL